MNKKDIKVKRERKQVINNHNIVNEIPAITVSYTKSTLDFTHEQFEYKVKGEKLQECLHVIDILIQLMEKKTKK